MIIKELVQFLLQTFAIYSVLKFVVYIYLHIEIEKSKHLKKLLEYPLIGDVYCTNVFPNDNQIKIVDVSGNGLKVAYIVLKLNGKLINSNVSQIMNTDYLLRYLSKLENTEYVIENIRQTRY
jgi:hypothetical protein